MSEQADLTTDAIGAATDAAGVWKPLIALAAVLVPIFLAFWAARTNTPTTIVDAVPDPATDTKVTDAVLASIAAGNTPVDSGD